LVHWAQAALTDRSVLAVLMVRWALEGLMVHSAPVVRMGHWGPANRPNRISTDYHFQSRPRLTRAALFF
ncbi:MAG: hypothetical protein WD793_13640, partial [Steroidobacteraceae bacterium]